MRSPCCDKSKVKKGPWSPVEDSTLANFIQKNGHENWRSLPKQAGLLRCGKSCRLRWINYLRPDVKRGNFTQEEEDTIIKLHSSLGNKWSKIATFLPGRTDNEIKNVWNTHLKKKTCLPTNESSSLINGEYSSVISSSPKSGNDQDMEQEKAEEQIDAAEILMPPHDHEKDYKVAEQIDPEDMEWGSSMLLNSMGCSGEVYNPMCRMADGRAIEIQTSSDDDEIPRMMMIEDDMDFWSMFGDLDNLERDQDLNLPPLELTNQTGIPHNSDNGGGHIKTLPESEEEAEYMKWLGIDVASTTAPETG